MDRLALLFFLFVTINGKEEALRRLPTDAPINNGYEQLEMGLEHTLTVDDELNDYYVIRMPAKNQPLLLRITPCNNHPVHWQLRIPNSFALRPNVHPQSRHFNYVLHMRIPPLIEFAEDLRAREKLILLAGEEGEKPMDFFAESIEADYVVLNMSSNRPTNVKLFATTLKSELDDFYPQLPKDSTLTFSLNQNDIKFDLNLKWSIPEYVTGSESKKYRFCVLVSRHQPQYSICQESSEDLDSMHCVASNISEVIIKNFEHSERYYVSVFIHNILTGGSSAYSPIEFRTPTRLSSEEKTLNTPDVETEFRQLQDSFLMKHQLNAPHGSSNDYIYRLPQQIADSKNVELVINACNGYVRLGIYKNGALVRKTSDFIGLERFIISSTQPGDSIRIQVINDDKIDVEYWIWASYEYDKSPFVDMPLDRTIRVAKRECNKAILHFSRAINDQNVRYCIHEKESSADFFHSVINEPTQMCWANLPVGRQAVCFKQSESEPLSDLHFPLPDVTMQTTVDNLKPSTTYRLDISAQNDRENAQPLSYRTVFVRTTDHC